MITGALLAVIMAPYIAILSAKPSRRVHGFVPGAVSRWLQAATQDALVDPGNERFPSPPSWAVTVAVTVAVNPLLAMVVVGSIGMVPAATVLGAASGLSDVILGTLLLATLTGIPNMVAAFRLALQRRGGAVVSEAFNSNSLNLIAVSYLPTIYVSVGPMSGAGRLGPWWLLGGTLLAKILFLRRGVLTRFGGGLLLVGYALFAGTVAFA